MKSGLLCLSTILFASSLQAQTSEATLVETPAPKVEEARPYTLGGMSPLFSLVELSFQRKMQIDAGLHSVRETYDGAQGAILHSGRVYGAESKLLIASPATARRGFIGLNYERSSFSTAIESVTTGVKPETKQETGLDEVRHHLSLLGGGRINDHIVVGVTATQMEERRTSKSGSTLIEGVAFTHRISPQVFFVTREFELGVIYKDQLKVSGTVPIQEAGSLAFALQRRTPSYFAGVRMTIHRENELNEYLKDSLTTQLGAEYVLNPILAVGGNFTYASGSAVDPTSYTYETIPSMQWAVLARIMASEGSWIHVSYAFQNSPRTADWQGGVTYGAFGSRATTSFALHQEI